MLGRGGLWDFASCLCLYSIINYQEAVADPGFPGGGGANSPGGGAPTYDFAKFPQKLHEIERIWTPGGVRPLQPPLDPPLLMMMSEPSLARSQKLAIQHCTLDV